MRRTGLLFVPVALAICLAGALLAARGRASDHKDAPGVQLDPGTDITDAYGFISPADANNFVMVLDVNPFPPGSPPATLFTPDALYQIHIDRGTDNRDDMTLTFTFSSTTPQTWKLEGLLPAAATGQVTPLGQAPVIYSAGGIKVFAGPRDDPFFFDLQGFKDFVAAPHSLAAGHGLRLATETPVDAFAGANVAAIVLEAPITSLTGQSAPNLGFIRAWVSTSKRI